ncbi:unnamed protein product [Rhizophagus irregularis]|nr:unnamed protein product [Rhizophagus irregularis]
MEMEKDFSSGDDNEYEDLEENLIEEDLESVIEKSSIQSELNNGEPLFEIDRDALANAKKFAQQNVSNEDEDEFSETESGEEHGEDRGANCEEHSYTISKNARYVCINCYENKGGHTYQHIGKGVKNDPNCDNMSHHNNDTIKALEAIGY